MYVEMDLGTTQGEVARYKSPMITSQDSSGICVRFWYNMYGSDVNTLKVGAFLQKKILAVIFIYLCLNYIYLYLI